MASIFSCRHWPVQLLHFTKFRLELQTPQHLISPIQGCGRQRQEGLGMKTCMGTNARVS